MRSATARGKWLRCVALNLTSVNKQYLFDTLEAQLHLDSIPKISEANKAWQLSKCSLRAFCGSIVREAYEKFSADARSTIKASFLVSQRSLHNLRWQETWEQLKRLNGKRIRSKNKKVLIGFSERLLQRAANKNLN